MGFQGTASQLITAGMLSGSARVPPSALSARGLSCFLRRAALDTEVALTPRVSSAPLVPPVLITALSQTLPSVPWGALSPPQVRPSHLTFNP